MSQAIQLNLVIIPLLFLAISSEYIHISEHEPTTIKLYNTTSIFSQYSYSAKADYNTILTLNKSLYKTVDIFIYNTEPFYLEDEDIEPFPPIWNYSATKKDLLQYEICNVDKKDKNYFILIKCCNCISSIVFSMELFNELYPYVLYAFPTNTYEITKMYGHKNALFNFTKPSDSKMEIVIKPIGVGLHVIITIDGINNDGKDIIKEETFEHKDDESSMKSYLVYIESKEDLPETYMIKVEINIKKLTIPLNPIMNPSTVITFMNNEIQHTSLYIKINKENKPLFTKDNAFALNFLNDNEIDLSASDILIQTKKVQLESNDNIVNSLYSQIPYDQCYHEFTIIKRYNKHYVLYYKGKPFLLQKNNQFYIVIYIKILKKIPDGNELSLILPKNLIQWKHQQGGSKEITIIPLHPVFVQIKLDEWETKDYVLIIKDNLHRLYKNVVIPDKEIVNQHYYIINPDEENESIIIEYDVQQSSQSLITLYINRIESPRKLEELSRLRQKINEVYYINRNEYNKNQQHYFIDEIFSKDKKEDNDSLWLVIKQKYGMFNVYFKQDAINGDIFPFKDSDKQESNIINMKDVHMYMLRIQCIISGMMGISFAKATPLELSFSEMIEYDHILQANTYTVSINDILINSQALVEITLPKPLNTVLTLNINNEEIKLDKNTSSYLLTLSSQSKTFTIISSNDCLINFKFFNDALYNDYNPNEETVSHQNILYKLNDNTINQYTFKFPTDISSNVRFNIGKGKDHKIPLPTRRLNGNLSSLTFDNPSLIYNEQLTIGEYYYISISIIDYTQPYVLTIEKSPIDTYDIIKQNQLSTINNTIKRTLTIKSDNNKKTLIFYSLTCDTSPPSLRLLFHNQCEEVEEFTSQQSIKVFDIKRYNYNIEYIKESKVDQNYFSYDYMTNNEAKKIQEDFSFGKYSISFDDESSIITWTKPLIDITTYRLFIVKSSLKEKTNEPCVLLSMKKYYTIDGKINKFSLEDNHLDQGKYDINIIAFNIQENTLNYHVLYKKKVINYEIAKLDDNEDNSIEYVQMGATEDLTWLWIVLSLFILVVIVVIVCVVIRLRIIKKESKKQQDAAEANKREIEIRLINELLIN